MAGSWVGGVSGTTSATIPTHAVGDLIIARAFRDGNNTAPTIPAGQNWTPIDNSAGSNSNGAAIAYKIATSTTEATGTWTSATRLDVGVWRGFSGIGGSAVDGAASSTVNYPTLTMSVGTGTSWVAGFGAHRSINTTLENPPGTMTNRLTAVTGTDEGAIHDTNGGVASWSGTTVSVGGTSSGWRAHTVELVLAATGSDGASAGTATATGIGASSAASVAASAGVATATATSTATSAAVGASVGVGAASGVGASSAAGIAASAGIAAVSGVGTSSAASDGASSGTGAATGIGASTADSVGASAGTATATAEGTYTGGASLAVSAGTSTATGIGASITAALGTSSGTSTVSGVGASVGGDEMDMHDGFSPSDAKALREHLNRRKQRAEKPPAAKTTAAPAREPSQQTTEPAQSAEPASSLPIVPAPDNTYYRGILAEIERLNAALSELSQRQIEAARRELMDLQQARATEAATSFLQALDEFEDEDDEDDLMLLMSI